MSVTADRQASCMRCDAVCCRMTVVLLPGDHVPGHLVDRDTHGADTMAHNDEGWCAAIDPLHLRCTIYADRPAICRSFTMAGDDCLAIRATYRDQRLRGIPLSLE